MSTESCDDWHSGKQSRRHVPSAISRVETFAGLFYANLPRDWWTSADAGLGAASLVKFAQATSVQRSFKQLKPLTLVTITQKEDPTMLLYKLFLICLNRSKRAFCFNRLVLWAFCLLLDFEFSELWCLHELLNLQNSFCCIEIL